MSCEGKGEELLAYLHGEVTAEETSALETHLARCEACQTELRELRVTVALTDRIPEVEPSAGFAARVRSAVEPIEVPAERLTARRQEVRIPAESRSFFDGWRRWIPRLSGSGLRAAGYAAALVLLVLAVNSLMQQKGRRPVRPAPGKTRPAKGRTFVITAKPIIRTPGGPIRLVRRPIPPESIDVEAILPDVKAFEKEDVRVKLKESLEVLEPVEATDVEELLLVRELPKIPERKRYYVVPAFQNRLIRKRKIYAVWHGGGSTQTQRAVIRGLSWLVAHQDRDGKWSGQAFRKNCWRHYDRLRENHPGNRRCGGAADVPGADLRLTSLALLALLGNGHTHLAAPYDTVLRRGLDWLVLQQRDDGAIVEGASAGGEVSLLDHSLASMVLAETYGLTHDQRYRRALIRGLEYLRSIQKATGEWAHPRTEPLVASAWASAALRASALATPGISRQTLGGAEVIDEPLRLAAARLQQQVQPSGSLFARYREEIRKRGEPSPGSAYALAAPRSPRADGVLQMESRYLARETPDWKRPNWMYWYCGTVTMQHVGGLAWRRWNRGLKDVLLREQKHVLAPGRRGSVRLGTWDPVGPDGKKYGRVYSTAFGVLCLEIYYRHAPKK